MDSLVERLRACADDPMWADHAEILKAWCTKAAALILRMVKKLQKITPTGR